MNGFKVVKEKKFMANHIKMNIMKNHYIFFLLIFSNFVFSQSKAIVPKTGTIVFEKKDTIYDKELYLKSWKEFLPKMKESLKKQVAYDRLAEGIKTDSVQLESIANQNVEALEMMLPFLVEEEERHVVKYYHEFKNDTIIQYQTANGNYSNEKRINQFTGVIISEINEEAKIEKHEEIKLTEYKNETKIINGFNCFKVVFQTNEQISELDLFSPTTTLTRELWVTEEIKCNYHPVINETEILEKYYPLEIIEYADEIKGIITKYKLVEFSLK